MNFTDKEALVLNRLQRGVPGVSEPFLAIAGDTGLTEDEVLEIVSRLKEEKVIRNISGIFEGKRLGYFLNLVAFEVPEDKVETAAAIISSHPGVSHNYLRNHRYNIWFTLAEENEGEFNKTISLLSGKSGAADHLVLKNEKLLKIGVFLNIGDSDESSGLSSGPKHENILFSALDQTAREAVLLLQNDLPVERHPFRKIAENSRIIHGEKELLVFFNDFLATGIMRRYSAVLKHRSAGYISNAMTTWKIDDNTDLDLFKKEKAISHLYLRTVYPGRWEYPLFAMIHAKTDNELENIINGLSEKSGIKDYQVLTSLREFKKRRVRYFSEEFKEWKRLNHD